MNALNPVTPVTILCPPDARRGPLHAYFAEHQDRLRDAARLLRGRSGLRLFHEVLAGLHGEAILSRRTMAELRRFEELLSLKHVADAGRPEAEYFAMIDPTDPAVEAVCRLTDGLRNAMQAYRALPRSPDGATR